MKVCAKGKQYPKKSAYIWAFLVTQWKRIHLPV